MSSSSSNSNISSEVVPRASSAAVAARTTDGGNSSNSSNIITSTTASVVTKLNVGAKEFVPGSGGFTNKPSVITTSNNSNKVSYYNTWLIVLYDDYQSLLIQLLLVL